MNSARFIIAIGAVGDIPGRRCAGLGSKIKADVNIAVLIAVEGEFNTLIGSAVAVVVYVVACLGSAGMDGVCFIVAVGVIGHIT